MDKRSFILGLAVGLVTSVVIFSGIGMDRLISMVSDDSMSPDEISTLRDETLGLRNLALQVVKGRSIAEMTDVGVVNVQYAFDGAHIARFEKGSVFLSLIDGRVDDILTYCWRYENLCTVKGKS